MSEAQKILDAEAAGVSRSEIAARAGVDSSVVHRITLGRKTKTPFLAQAVSTAAEEALVCLSQRRVAADAIADMTNQQRQNLARALGVAYQTVRYWGEGRSLPPWRRIGDIAAGIEKVKNV